MELELKNEDLKTLTECLNLLKKQGFDKDFLVVENGVKISNSEEIFRPEEVKIKNFYRFEGESDPGDMSILYAIETNSGIKGTLVDAYGPYASKKVTDFIVQVDEIHKKTDE